MNSRKALGLVAVISLAANMAVTDVFTIGGYTFDDDNSVTTAAVVEGGVSPKIHSAPLFAGKGDLGSAVNRSSSDLFLTFQRQKTIGRLLGTPRRKTVGDPSLFVSMPDRRQAPPRPNVDRCTIELTWGGKGLRNKPGEDFVVYEVGTFEGFAVSVKKAGSDTFTPPRYHFAKQLDLVHDVNSVAFDLSQFGLADGEMITAIRIRNLFNSEATAGADKVDDASGQGRVLYPGEAGYDTGHTLTARLVGSGLQTDEGIGGEFSTDRLGADIVFVVGLHNLEKVEEK